jgi:hypothetical protein
MQRAYASIYETMQQQSAVLAYKDTIIAMAVIILLLIPLVLSARKPQQGEVHVGH